MNSFRSLTIFSLFVPHSPIIKLTMDLPKMIDFFVIIPEQDQINDFLKLISYAFEGTNTLIILDDCAASKDVKIKTNELVNLAFSARHKGISVWVLTQQMTSIAKAFRENIACLVLFYSPSARDMKITFENYAGDLTNEKKKIFEKVERSQVFSS